VIVESGFEGYTKTPGLRVFETAEDTDAERGGLFDYRMKGFRAGEDYLPQACFRIDVVVPKSYYGAGTGHGRAFAAPVRGPIFFVFF